MSYEQILFERDGAVATITINREPVRNALNVATQNEIFAALREVEADPQLRVVIITGAGEKAFVAGADINELRALDTATAAREYSQNAHQLGFFISDMSKVVIAAVNGYALGGGCELAMACDIRIASDAAKFGQPEVNLGVMAGWGGSQRLTRLVGPGMSRLLNLTGEVISAEEALRIGLVERVVPAAEFRERVRELAQQIASKAPLAVAAIKQAINRGMSMPLNEACMYEGALFGDVVSSEDAREGTSAFLEKRSATWKGR
jgi:enoyl-CoA hydratase